MGLENRIEAHNEHSRETAVEISHPDTLQVTQTQSMDYLVGMMNGMGIDVFALDHGELSAIHSVLQDLAVFAAQGDVLADMQLGNGLAQAKDLGFNVYSVQAVFGR